MLLLIDGSSLLSTSYYATLPKSIMFEKDPEKKRAMYPQIMHAPDGRYTNGILGFMRSLNSMLKKQKPTHVFIAFDKTRATFRRQLYPEYKAQRKETPEPLKEQFVTIENMLIDGGLAVEFSDQYEADDLIASVVEKYKGHESIRIWTKDQDYFQLVEDACDIRIWMPMDKTKIQELNTKYRGLFGYSSDMQFIAPENVFEFTEDTVEDYFGVHPTLVPDYKGIAGDTSDNIPGVKGVSSAAIPLLKEYGSVEGVYEALDDCDEVPTKEKELSAFWKDSLGIKRSPLKALKEHKEDAILSKQLATMKKDCALSHDYESLKTDKIKQDKLNEWYTTLGMESLK